MKKCHVKSLCHFSTAWRVSDCHRKVFFLQGSGLDDPLIIPGVSDGSSDTFRSALTEPSISYYRQWIGLSLINSVSSKNRLMLILYGEYVDGRSMSILGRKRIGQGHKRDPPIILCTVLRASSLLTRETKLGKSWAKETRIQARCLYRQIAGKTNHPFLMQCWRSEFVLKLAASGVGPWTVLSGIYSIPDM